MSEFIETPIKKTKKANIRVISEMSSLAILWFLIKRNKTLLFAVWAIAMTINWAIPEWQSFIGAFLLS